MGVRKMLSYKDKGFLELYPNVKESDLKDAENTVLGKLRKYLPIEAPILIKHEPDGVVFIRGRASNKEINKLAQQLGVSCDGCNSEKLMNEISRHIVPKFYRLYEKELYRINTFNKEYSEIELLEEAKELGYEYVEYYGNGQYLLISDLIDENECTNDCRYILFNSGVAKQLDEYGYLFYPNKTEINFFSKVPTKESGGVIESRVTVFDDKGNKVSRVRYNANLDYWNGREHQNGGSGRHKGLTKLQDGRYVLIFGTDFQGEKDRAEVISPEEALRLILKSGNSHLLKTKKFRALRKLYEEQRLKENGLEEEEE